MSTTVTDTTANPWAAKARTEKAIKLSQVLWSVASNNKLNVTGADLAGFVREMTPAQKSAACAKVGIRPASDMTWELVIQSLIAADPKCTDAFAGVHGHECEDVRCELHGGRNLLRGM